VPGGHLQDCNRCPTNAVSAERSTSLSSCECAAGYTGDAGVGKDCVSCEAGSYKDVIGSATCKVCSVCLPCLAGTYMSTTDAFGCTACPTNAVSAEGSTALSSCECDAGYTGDAGVGEDCVACEAGTHADVSGSATCNALTGPKKRSWMDSSTGFFLDGPSERSNFGCAEAGGKVYMFGGIYAQPPLDGSGEHLFLRPEYPLVSVSTILYCCCWIVCSICPCCILAFWRFVCLVAYSRWCLPLDRI
jgi:hypothetical protein